MTWFPRLLGAATAAYSVAIIAKPELFARPTGLIGDHETADDSQKVLTRAIGGRDLASGIAMAFAPAGWPLKTAIGVRVGADIADLVVLGTGLPDQNSREKATMVAAGWGALCALSVLAADAPGKGRKRRKIRT
ncbi:hypothetical protein EV383_5932 [Pseudonocardia sediminis]|uniref:DoxX-like protein n=1 Tax=Pseudonocardia sediminis TaxID=1397368 RepID=A0A4Q7V5H3_PSEST|nr:hypothetical protein [Pseudonocardia sediminis]RZT88978.1 hypothetical protein EV383_5932 [Pseudonocardia sediminis]